MFTNNLTTRGGKNGTGCKIADDGGQLANLMQIIQVASRPNFVKVKVITAESYSDSYFNNETDAEDAKGRKDNISTF